MTDKATFPWLGMEGCNDPIDVGGKAATLSRLFGNFKIPPGFVVAEANYSTRQVANALLQLGKGPYAVRSSAIGEDGSNASYAGVHESVLNVFGARGVTSAIDEVFDSVDSDKAEAYRKAMGLPKPAMRVLVQLQAPNAQMSGTAFSLNPVTGVKELVIEAEAGVGGVVDGTTTPTTIAVPHGEAPKSDANYAGLPWPIIGSVYGLVESLVEIEGHPVDAEWCHDGKDVWLLQCREITTVKEAKNSEA